MKIFSKIVSVFYDANKVIEKKRVSRFFMGEKALVKTGVNVHTQFFEIRKSGEIRFHTGSDFGVFDVGIADVNSSQIQVFEYKDQFERHVLHLVFAQD